MRVAVVLSYNGAVFTGSQIQKDGSKTVFGTLDEVLKKLGIESKVVASGRTDRGVHATAQVCHFDLPVFWDDADKLRSVINKMLPKSIHIKKVFFVDDDFHARYSAIKRVYRYILKDGESNVFESDFVTFVDRIDIKEIQQKISLFAGEHDFKNFMKSGSSVGSTNRIIYKAFAYRYKGYTVLYFEANGFLRSQIRMMVGAIFHLDNDDIIAMLNSDKKIKTPKLAPPNGLYLAKIKYRHL